jgi:deoxyribose-phosphate aldolase
VWHKEDDEWINVAKVQAGNLLAALVFTINRKDASWSDNVQVTAFLPDARSTEVGDVIVNPEGVAYQVQTTHDGLVFQVIDFPQSRDQKALLAEWKADYLAARERDLAEVSQRSPEVSWAANDNEKDQDRGGRE